MISVFWAFTFLPLVVFGGIFKDEPNVWKSASIRQIVEKKEEPVEKKNENKYEKLYSETLSWLNEHEKVPPVLRELWKNPEDEKLKKLAVKTMYDWNKKLENITKELGMNFSQMSYLYDKPSGQYWTLRSPYTSADGKLREYAKRGLKVIYFFSPDCPYCILSEPAIKRLKDAGIEVLEINVKQYGKNEFVTKMVDLYNVSATPTTIWFFKGSSSGYKYVGVLTVPVILNILDYIGGKK